MLLWQKSFLVCQSSIEFKLLTKELWSLSWTELKILAKKLLKMNRIDTEWKVKQLQHSKRDVRSSLNLSIHRNTESGTLRAWLSYLVANSLGSTWHRRRLYQRFRFRTSLTSYDLPSFGSFLVGSWWIIRGRLNNPPQLLLRKPVFFAILQIEIWDTRLGMGPCWMRHVIRHLMSQRGRVFDPPFKGHGFPLWTPIRW